MSKFKVWDKFNSNESHGIYVTAFDAEEAAIQYAEEDVDGHIDGVYSGSDGHEICVLDENGKVVVCRVGVEEFEPVYAAYEVKSE